MVGDISCNVSNSIKDATYLWPVNSVRVVDFLVSEKKVDKRTRFNNHCSRNICRSKEICHVSREGPL
jgi:hypothetical protein